MILARLEICHALFLGDRIDTRSLEAADKIAALPLLVRAGEKGYAVIFRYGAVVFFDLSVGEQSGFLDRLRPLVHGPKAKPDTEDVTIRIDPAVDGERAENGVVILKELTTERIQTVADILGKSVILAHYESSVASIFDTIEPLAERLRAGERSDQHGKQLLSHIGAALHIQHRVVGRAEIDDKPEFLWNLPEVERLYVRLQDEYELVERHRVLHRKIDLIGKTAETLLQLSQAERALRIEILVVVLIVLEIGLTLLDMFVLRD